MKGKIKPEVVSQIKKGVDLPDLKTTPALITNIKVQPQQKTFLHITIHEGQKRQIRKLFFAFGYPVVYLKRIRIGTLSLGDLEKGTYRHLTPAEINSLLNS